jgi:hypothetical protein
MLVAHDLFRILHWRSYSHLRRLYTFPISHSLIRLPFFVAVPNGVIYRAPAIFHSCICLIRKGVLNSGIPT